AVLSGTADAVVAGGVQNMSAIPISAAMLAGREHGFPDPFSGSTGWRTRYGDVEVSQFRSADMIARHWDLTREQLEEFALRSHRRALEAADTGRFAGEIAPFDDRTADEGPRRGTSAEQMAALAPLSDGASAALVVSEAYVRDHGLRPRARIHHLSVSAADPVWMLTGPIPATHRALRRTGLTVEDIDLFEVNEAFASVVLAWLDETGA